ncbi:tRNA pseudouridine synthase A [Candidatus Izimaplasma bacterium HR1]|jgi:tRNA pseudouridine38-40 synthase|uniref:tRNA pseudouridine(38-40) synthase TruA n=1 Tax=Candidatus Izimoplasma sp. HR1 TaxID=1541959 RepID=UPI0004F8D931|nr:tRNA pseudouridine synthase A [Candidatus Izimaplasma bacterium HR1]
MSIEKQNYKMTISYDGTHYKGWQRLKNDEKSIQFKIERVLSELYKSEIKIIGSGRTDAGVHALCQIANFHAENAYSTEEIYRYVNHYLPEDIAVSNIEIMDEQFHSRFNVSEKHYQYKIWNGIHSSVFERKNSYWVKDSLNISKMREASKLLIGKHNFLGFSSKSKKKNTIKDIYNINISSEGSMISIDIFGEGFLYNMVRIIVGTLIEIGQSKKDIDVIQQIFSSGIREEAGFTVPGKGLCLVNVTYN